MSVRDMGGMLPEDYASAAAFSASGNARSANEKADQLRSELTKLQSHVATLTAEVESLKGNVACAESKIESLFKHMLDRVRMLEAKAAPSKPMDQHS